MLSSHLHNLMYLVKPGKSQQDCCIHGRQNRHAHQVLDLEQGHFRVFLQINSRPLVNYFLQFKVKANDHDLYNFEGRQMCLRVFFLRPIRNIRNHAVLMFKQQFVLSVNFEGLSFKTIGGVFLHRTEKQ